MMATTKQQHSSSSSLITVATCNLNQWALDFDGNLERIWESCVLAKQRGASYRLGPELELCGYGCEDHFLESDTIEHCWESLVELLTRGASDELLCDFGMPVLFHGARYNCRVLCYNRRILLVRPKLFMADNGNYRESRYFTAYEPPSRGCQQQQPQNMLLPLHVQQRLDQVEAPFGIHYLKFGDSTTVGCESCEELWTPHASHIDACLHGVEIIGNGSGSHHELRKLNERLSLMTSATSKCGGVYLYANQRGCDGGRLYYDGCAMIVVNGQVLAQAEQFDTASVQVITATVDLDDVRSYRASIPSFGIQATTAASSCSHKFISCIDTLTSAVGGMMTTVPRPSLFLHSPEEECCLGPACWLWDYLRRSGAAGFLLPLSGGADSSSVAAIVGAMCQMVTKAAQDDPQGKVAQDCRRVCQKQDEEQWVPSSPQDMAHHVFYTIYMGTENSSDITRSRAKRLAEAIGSHHLALNMDLMVQAVLKVFCYVTNKTPRFTSQGGTMTEDLALQNIQARLRMVTAYLFAQLLPWVNARTGFLLVLGSANVDEGLRGYMTKYDCSSADLNPIGAISKQDLKRMLLWASTEYPGYEVLAEVAGAPPTAELRPITSSQDEEHSQLDEDEMGMTYEELGLYGKLRKISRCGPVSMYRKLRVTWQHLSAKQVAEKVKKFFWFYSINRHKMCTITPAYHAEAYSPDDNRFDLRQFLYPKWTRQFAVIDGLVNSSGTSKEEKQQDGDDTVRDMTKKDE